MATANIQRRKGNKRTGYESIAVEWPGGQIYVYEAKVLSKDTIIAMHQYNKKNKAGYPLYGKSLREFISENTRVRNGWSYKYMKNMYAQTVKRNEAL